MSEIKDQMKKNDTNKISRGIAFSEEFLDIEVIEGRVYEGHIRMESADKKMPVQGKVYSTNDKVVPKTEEFHGTRVDIPFYFKGKLATSGVFFNGDFVFVTNMGEYNIPYHISVIDNYAQTSLGRIHTMEEFCTLYKKNRKEAQNIFFLSSFPQIFLKDPTLRHLYRCFQKSRKRAYIVEEFLVSAGYKETAACLVKENRLTFQEGSDRAELHLFLQREGYLECSVHLEKDQVKLSAHSFTSDDFTEGEYTLLVTREKGQTAGSDTIYITTARQEFAVSVEWRDAPAKKQGPTRGKLRFRKSRADLMHNYLSFRTGSIGLEDFTQEAVHVLDEISLANQNPCLKLYRIHILLMQDKREMAGDLLRALEESGELTAAGSLTANYYLYIKALYYKTTEAINQAVLSVRELYEGSSNKAEALWMLIYLDREYVYNRRLQYDTIKQLFEAGCNSCLLYFEACDILNDNPDFMDKLGSFEIGIFRWGVRYGYVSMELALRFVRLALRVKFFKKSIFYIALQLYKVEPDERFLQLICSLLIKGNRTGKKYHSYFRDGIEANLKLIGLSEFFIRSMDYTVFEQIPQKVLIYFTYSNSLNSAERAYLYANILKNQEYYEEVFGTYYEKMLPFAIEQLEKGQINEHLAYIYTYFKEEILENRDYSRQICDILFCCKLVCHNPAMVGVYVDYPEISQERYYPFSQGTARVEVFNRRTRLYFVNAQDQRFCDEIDYTLVPYMDLSLMSREWMYKNQHNRKLMLMQSVNLDETIEEEDLDMAKRIYEDDLYAPWLKKKAIEAILMYYGNHNHMEELKRWLNITRYSDVTAGFRERLIEYFLKTGLVENAFFGIELYGSEVIHYTRRLSIAEFGVDYFKGEKDETTLSLAYGCLLSNYCSPKILWYLIEHFEGEIGDYLTLWQRSRDRNLDTVKLEERILRQCVFTGNHDPLVYEIFEKYYSAFPNSNLNIDYLKTLTDSGSYKKNLPLHIQMILGAEIVKGRITDREVFIHFLYYFAEKKTWLEQVKDMAVYIIEKLLEEKIYLPVYHAYEKYAALPIEYKEKTFLTYRGEKGQKVILYYSLKGEGKGEGVSREKSLSEILPGLYICALYFFRKDHVIYRLEADGERVLEEKNLKFETFDYKEEASRYFLLNRLAAQSEALEELETCLKQTYFAESHMKLL